MWGTQEHLGGKGFWFQIISRVWWSIRLQKRRWRKCVARDWIWILKGLFSKPCLRIFWLVPNFLNLKAFDCVSKSIETIFVSEIGIENWHFWFFLLSILGFCVVWIMRIWNSYSMFWNRLEKLFQNPITQALSKNSNPNLLCYVLVVKVVF